MRIKLNAVVSALVGMVLATSCTSASTTTITSTLTQTVTTGSTVTETVTPPLATSESRIANGFEFGVTVSNTHPRLGETVIINAKLLNLYNTTTPIDRIFGDIVLQIADGQGNIVWKEIKEHPPVPTTTPAPPAGTGYKWDFTRTWIAGGNYRVPATGTYTPVLPLVAGNYILSAETIFGLAVTPIQITVAD